MTLLLLTGCRKIIIAEPMSSDVLVDVDGVECKTAEGVFRLMEVKDYYRNDAESGFFQKPIGDITIDEYLKDSVKNEMIRITCTVTMADKMAVYIDDEEQQILEKNALDSYNWITLNYDLSTYGITLNDVVDLYTKQVMYDKLFEKLSEKVNVSISEADTKVIEINYVELPADMAFAKIEDLRREIKNGTDFKTACEASGFKPVMDKVIMKGEMPAAFDELAFSLVDGELSEIVETTDCLYLIQCIEDYMINESVANYNEKLLAAKQEAFDEYFAEYAEESVMRFNDEVWESVSVSGLR